MTALAGQLSLGWLAGSTSLLVAGQTTCVPNVVDVVEQKLLLYSAAAAPGVTPLSADDVDQLLNQTDDVSGVSEQVDRV